MVLILLFYVNLLSHLPGLSKNAGEVLLLSEDTIRFLLNV